MEEKLKEIYILGKEAKEGNDVSLIKLINMKKRMINKFSYGNEDCYQYIIEKIIKSIKKYKFWKTFVFYYYL